MDGVTEVADVDDPHGHADQGDDFGELLAKLVQFLLKWCLLLFCSSHLITDLTDFSADACSHDDTYGTTCSDVSALRNKNLKNGNECEEVKQR